MPFRGVIFIFLIAIVITFVFRNRIYAWMQKISVDTEEEKKETMNNKENENG